MYSLDFGLKCIPELFFPPLQCTQLWAMAIEMAKQTGTASSIQQTNQTQVVHVNNKRAANINWQNYGLFNLINARRTVWYMAETTL